MRKQKFFPFEKELTDNRLDALRRVRPDIVQSRPLDQLPERKVWRGFIKKLICPDFLI